METLENRSKNNTLLKVNVCLDYSGQWDIAQSCKKLMIRYHTDMLLEESVSKDIPIESVISGNRMHFILTCRISSQFVDW